MTERMPAADREAMVAAATRDRHTAEQALIAEHVAAQALRLGEVATEAIYDLPGVWMVREVSTSTVTGRPRGPSRPPAGRRSPRWPLRPGAGPGRQRARR